MMRYVSFTHNVSFASSAVLGSEKRRRKVLRGFSTQIVCLSSSQAHRHVHSISETARTALKVKQHRLVKNWDQAEKGGETHPLGGC